MNTASQLVEWAGPTLNYLEIFFCKSFRVQDEMMWRHYHELRVSDTFKKDWDTFLEQTIDHTASPTFYQFISHRLFQEVIKKASNS